MRVILILAMFTASLASAGWHDYKETKALKLDAGGITTLELESRAGSLDVTGDTSADEIAVTAIIAVPGEDEERAQEIIADRLVLSIEKQGKNAVLKGYFDTSNWTLGDSPSVRLEVNVPAHLALIVDDSSGSIKINDVSGDIKIDDSSGSIDMNHVGGSIAIVDSSGSISLKTVGGDVNIEDGSGSISVREVDGSVIIDDGSGSITVNDVVKDLIIVNDGSGSVNYSNVQGSVENNG